jgi:hypothetical protein
VVDDEVFHGGAAVLLDVVSAAVASFLSMLSLSRLTAVASP